MNVSSPVGEFPYTLDRLELRGGALVLHGHMGTWPSRIEIEPADLPRIGRLLAVPLAVGGGLALLAALARRWG